MQLTYEAWIYLLEMFLNLAPIFFLQSFARGDAALQSQVFIGGEKTILYALNGVANGLWTLVVLLANLLQ